VVEDTSVTKTEISRKFGKPLRRTGLVL
jgi:hypothetical protein